MGVVRRVLEVPAQLTRVRVEGDDGARVEVVSGSDVAVPIGRGIADRPVQEVEVVIVRSREPGRSPAGLPGVALPGLAARFSRRRDRVETPDTLAGGGVVGVDEPAHAGFRAAYAHDDLAVDRERRQGQRETDVVVRHPDIPAHRAGRRIERDEVRVERADVDRVVEHRDAAIHPRETDVLDLVRHVRRPGPDSLAGARIERRHRTRRFGEIHDPVDDERRRLDQPVARVGGRLHLVGPDDPQVGHVLPVDLVERRIALRAIATGVGQPVVRILRRVQQSLEADLGKRGLGCQHQGDSQEFAHHSLLRVIM